MNCLSEAMGLALPGNGTIPAPYSERLRLAKESGERVMGVLANGLGARRIVDDRAIANAMTADMALGCSTNTVLHLAAIATRPGSSSRCSGSTTSPRACPTSAASPRRGSTTWRTSTAPAASRRSCGS